MLPVRFSMSNLSLPRHIRSYTHTYININIIGQWVEKLPRVKISLSEVHLKNRIVSRPVASQMIHSDRPRGVTWLLTHCFRTARPTLHIRMVDLTSDSLFLPIFNVVPQACLPCLWLLSCLIISLISVSLFTIQNYQWSVCTAFHFIQEY